MGYVIISKPNVLGYEGRNSRCRRVYFSLNPTSILATRHRDGLTEIMTGK